MKVYTHHFKQFVPASLDETWHFFASPLNLQKITPEFMKFVVTSDFQEHQQMYQGMLISYKVSPIFNIPLSWVTEITAIEKKKYFIDEQRFGPFKLWHHEHHFKAVDSGVMMEDRLSYALPLGVLGNIAHALSVENKVREIFKYREEAIHKLFS